MTNLELVNKLKWQCRRGMLELDVILLPFLEQHFNDLPQAEQKSFVDLLKHADPDIYTWIMGYGDCKHLELLNIIRIIREKMSIA